MAQSIAKILLWLFVINLGIAFGAGLYESIIAFPQWLSSLPEDGYHWNAEAARQANTGLRFWVYATTVPLTLITLLNLIAAWRSRGAIRRWWLGAVAVVVIERIMTFSYFIPTMVRLQSGALPESDAVAIALQWGRLNHLRHVLTLLGWLSALKAFSLLPKTRISRAMNPEKI
jgi:Domain of unknown function (DUF1772)